MSLIDNIDEGRFNLLHVHGNSKPHALMINHDLKEVK